jgi:hypothetical protein
MTRIDRVFKQLSELYDFKRKLKAYKLKDKAKEPLKEDAQKTENDMFSDFSVHRGGTS